MKGKNFIVPLVVYPFDVMVSICQTDEEIEGELRKHLPERCYDELHLAELKNGVQGRAVMFSNGATLLRLRHRVKYASVRGHLAHEVFHIVEMVMDRIDIKHSLECGEAYAYVLRLCVCLPLAQAFNLPQMLMGQIAQNRCYRQ